MIHLKQYLKSLENFKDMKAMTFVSKEDFEHYLRNVMARAYLAGNNEVEPEKEISPAELSNILDDKEKLREYYEKRIIVGWRWQEVEDFENVKITYIADDNEGDGNPMEYVFAIEENGKYVLVACLGYYSSWDSSEFIKVIQVIPEPVDAVQFVGVNY